MAYGELYIEPIKPQRHAITKRFIKGHECWNKGMKPSDWLPQDKYAEWKEKAVANLIKSRGNRKGKPSAQAKRCVCINPEGKFAIFESAEEASRKLGLCCNNIRRTCRHIGKTCGGLRWFWESDSEWQKLIKQ